MKYLPISDVIDNVRLEIHENELTRINYQLHITADESSGFGKAVDYIQNFEILTDNARSN